MGILKKIEFWREERKIHKAYAVVKKEWEEEEYINELWRLDQERRLYSDRKLIAKARRHYVPIPPQLEKDGFWQYEGEDYWFLTEKGVSHLRNEIRAEKRANLESWKTWIAIISGIIVAIGALAAYLSK